MTSGTRNVQIKTKNIKYLKSAGDIMFWLNM